MRLSKQLIMAFSLLEDFENIKGIINWPKFSLTSFLMISRLRRQGIFPSTVLDIGANVGQFAIACAKLFPAAQIYSFEPGPASIVKFQKNTSGLKNIRLFPVALGDEENVKEFFENEYSPSSSLMPLSKSHQEAFPHAVGQTSHKVQVRTLDSIALEIDLKHKVLMKIDVQGYEAPVLLGAHETLKNVDYVLIETSFEHLYEGEKLFREILTMMEASDFEFTRPVDTFSDERTGKILQMDALFTRKNL